MVLLLRWPVEWRDNDHVRDVVSFMEGEWSLQRSPV